MTIKGDLKLEIDEMGLEVRITITPDENGAELSPESLQAMFAEKKVRSGIDTEAIDKAFRTLARKKAEPVSFVAAAGTQPTPGTPESVIFEAAPYPDRLATVAATVLAAAPLPRGFRLREEKVKRERKVLKKSALPFLPPKEQIEIVMEKRIVREDVEIDPTVTDTGFVREGSIVARVKPGTQGKEGKNVFGRLVSTPRSSQEGFLCCAGLTRTGAEIKADVTGFLRRGDNWAEIIAFRDHVLDLSASRDGLTCLLSFTPGDPAAPPPTAVEVTALAATKGFAAAGLLPSPEIDAMLKSAITRAQPLSNVSLSPVLNGVALVTVSADKLKAVLYLRKSRGGGTPLTPAAASEAIRSSKVKGFAPDTVRRDLLAFFAGKAPELTDYVLVSGRPPKGGTPPKIEWKALFLPAEETAVIKAAAAANKDGLSSLSSLAQFPAAKVEAVARVRPDSEVLKVVTSTGGEPGLDVYGAAIAPGSAGLPEIRLFESLAMRKDLVVATKAGILEKGSDGTAILLRVRPHKDAELLVIISPDRMRASLSFSPPEGDGSRITSDDALARIGAAGVKRGFNEERLHTALNSIGRNEPLIDFLMAEGRPPQQDTKKRVTFHVRVATGKSVTVRKDGSADYKNQDRITRVRKGELIATVQPRDPATEDGWDVTGIAIPLPRESQETFKAGRGVREDVQQDGSIRFTAEAAGELVRDGATLSIMEAHNVTGDVGLATGNINFPGNVRISGSIKSGFTVMAGGVLEVAEGVEAALLSADGSITVGQGIKGEGRAIVRTKRDIVSGFAERSVLLAIGDVHLRGPCVRSQVKCRGKLILDSEKGALVGGEVRASHGASVHNLGSPGGAHTIISFGQDFLVKDQIEREDREVATLTKKVSDLDMEMLVLEKRVEANASAAGAVVAQSQDAAALGRARAGKLSAMKLMEQRKLRLITLHDKYDEHIPSEIVVRGTLYPGVVLESHGRRYETNVEKKMITLHFDPAQGKIVEKL